MKPYLIVALPVLWLASPAAPDTLWAPYHATSSADGAYTIASGPSTEGLWSRSDSTILFAGGQAQNTDQFRMELYIDKNTRLAKNYSADFVLRLGSEKQTEGRRSLQFGSFVARFNERAGLIAIEGILEELIEDKQQISLTMSPLIIQGGTRIGSDQIAIQFQRSIFLDLDGTAQVRIIAQGASYSCWINDIKALEFAFASDALESAAHFGLAVNTVAHPLIVYKGPDQSYTDLSSAPPIEAIQFIGRGTGWSGFVNSKTYYRKDYQYLKTMVADIRRPQNHMRVYTDEALPFTRPETTDGDDWGLIAKAPILGRANKEHRFGDVGFGENFTWWGYNYDVPTPDNKMAVKGLTVFLEPSVHMLLDFNANSKAVINADYRLGGGVSGRGIPTFWLDDKFRWGQFSWHLKFFHESTHLGDEFVLDALHRYSLYTDRILPPEDIDPTQPQNPILFQRYNVSYNAFELYLTYDHYNAQRDYKRLYMGGRRLTKGDFRADPLIYADPANLSDPEINAPLLAQKNEIQLGGEYFNRLQPGHLQSGHPYFSPNWWIREFNQLTHSIKGLKSVIPELAEADYGVLAQDTYFRSQYAKQDPDMSPSLNFVGGLIWGRYFDADEGIDAFGLFINYYTGPNPHGQFRVKKLKYWGLDFYVSL